MTTTKHTRMKVRKQARREAKRKAKHVLNGDRARAAYLAALARLKS